MGLGAFRKLCLFGFEYFAGRRSPAKWQRVTEGVPHLGRSSTERLKRTINGRDRLKSKNKEFILFSLFTSFFYIFDSIVVAMTFLPQTKLFLARSYWDLFGPILWVSRFNKHLVF